MIQTNGKNYNFGQNFRSLLGVIFLDQTYLTITFPLITLIFFDAQSRLFPIDTPASVRSTWYGLCVAFPYMINMFFAPMLSILSDEFGRKKMLLVEIASAFLFTTLVGLGVYLGKIALIFAGFLIKGAFSRTNPTALAIIGDMAPRPKKILYMGYLQFAISVGAALGPIIGGYIASRYFFTTLNYAFPFFIAATLALANTLLANYFLKETLPAKIQHAPNRINLQAIKETFARKEILHISLILLLIQLSWSTYYQFTPPILKTIYQINSQQLGFFIGMIAVWLAIATGIGIKLLQEFLSLYRLLLLSMYLVLIGLLITALACAKLLPADFYLTWLGAMPIATGDVIAYSCLTALYSNAVAHEKQGKVMGMAFIIIGGAWATTGSLGGVLMSISTLLPLLVAPISILAAILLMHSKFGKNLVAFY